MSTSIGQRTVKNAAYGFVSYLWPIILGFVLTPIVIHKLGIASYGVYVLFLTVISFFSLFNFGFTYTFTRELAASGHEKNDSHQRLRKIFGATLVVFMAVGVLAFIAGIVLMYIGPGMFNIDPGHLATAQLGFLLVGAVGLVNSMTLVYSHIPFALQRQDIGTNIILADITLTNLAIILLLWNGYGVASLIFVQLISGIAELVVLYILSRRLVPWLTPDFTADRALYKTMGTAGGYLYLHNLSSTFLANLDRLIISVMVGPSVLTYYSVPNSVTEKIQGTITSLSGILFPLSSQLVQNGEHQKLQQLYRRAMTAIILLATAISISLAVLGAKVLLYWVGPEIAAQSTALLAWLIPTYFLLAIYMPLTNFLGGLGKTKFLAGASAGMALLNIVLLIILLPRYGILGAAIAYFFSLLPVMYIIHRMERDHLGITGSRTFYGALCGKLLTTAIVFLGIVMPLSALFIHGLISVVIGGPLAVLFFIALYKLFGFFAPEDWNVMREVGRAFLRKLMILRA